MYQYAPACAGWRQIGESRRQALLSVALAFRIRNEGPSLQRDAGTKTKTIQSELSLSGGGGNRPACDGIRARRPFPDTIGSVGSGCRYGFVTQVDGGHMDAERRRKPDHSTVLLHGQLKNTGNRRAQSVDLTLDGSTYCTRLVVESKLSYCIDSL